uniref:ARAD1A08932p n=1 Tax=Blastobotrys adeninivorans TaxID=409370 RepID=A0A060T3D7_BLAAD
MTLPIDIPRDGRLRTSKTDLEYHYWRREELYRLSVAQTDPRIERELLEANKIIAASQHRIAQEERMLRKRQHKALLNQSLTQALMPSPSVQRW